MTKGSKDLCATITPRDNGRPNVAGGLLSAKSFLVQSDAMGRQFLIGTAVLLIAIASMAQASEGGRTSGTSTELSVQGTRFAINGKPTFLFGISYYAALGAPTNNVQQDLNEMQRLGFNWLRVWATWGAFSNDVSAVDAEGAARDPYFSRLKSLVTECNRRGMIVDISLSRGNGITGPPRLGQLSAHQRAVETLLTGLKDFRNWYLDLSNERNIKDKRYTSFADLRELRSGGHRIDPRRLITASHAGDITREELKEYLTNVSVDFISPHRPRGKQSPFETAAKTREYLASMQEIGRSVPVHYQEPFRRGFGSWEPTASDFATDLRQAKEGGAAGWCFHNGDQRAKTDGRPRRSFDLSGRRLFEGLDEEESAFLRTLQSRD